ncbi:MAG: putative sulfate exporter family transporter [Planctomycetes bacterium]|nr:putative sulfate exporter family transporter [Planctomycetota bacterium]MCP4861979.1 putative sulfate exporter family transporter [Planctomycetota bacterium]
MARLLPGILLATLLAWLAKTLAATPLFHDRLHMGGLLLVILLGMLLRLLMPPPQWVLPGLEVSRKPILRWAVAALGLRLSLGDIATIGMPALAVVSITTLVGVAFGWWVAKRFKLPHELGLLLGVGGAVCGASAIVAADTVVQADKRDSAVAIGVITLLGTIGIFTYPLLMPLLGLTDVQYGVWAGASLHETAQVVAAGETVSSTATEVATVAKLVRICWLAPIVWFLARSRRRSAEASGEVHVSPVPWFLVAFVLFAAINSLHWLPEDGLLGTTNLKNGGGWLMAIGMAGVGLQTSLRDLFHVGARPVLAGAVQWLVMAILSCALIFGLERLV